MGTFLFQIRRSQLKLISLVSGVIGATYFIHKSCGVVQKQPDQVQKSATNFYQDWHADCQQQIDALLAKHGVDGAAIEQAKQQQLQAYKAYMQESIAQMPVGQELSQALLDMVARVAQDFGIPRNCFSVRSLNGRFASGQTSHMCTIDTTILIDEELFNRYSEKARMFVIAHELQHIKYQDCLLDFILEEKLSLDDIQQYDHPLNVISRLQEMRADLAAISKDIVYAQGQQEFLEQFAAIYKGTDAVPSHPKLAERMEQGRLVLAMFDKATVLV